MSHQSQDDPSIQEIMQEFAESFSAEVRSKFARLDGIIGKDHWASVGAYKERVVKEQLIQYIPKQFTVSTGFVLAANGTQKVLSDQIDLLIWDSVHHAPYFQDGDFVIIPPLACKAAIEVKGNLDHAQLRQGLENLRSITRFRDWVFQGGQSAWYQTYLLGLSLADNLNFPDTIWNTLNRMYLECPYNVIKDGAEVEQVDLTLAERVQFSAAMSETWSLPWVSAVGVLGHGVIKLHHVEFGEGELKRHLAFYPVVQPAIGDRDNTIGLLRNYIVSGLLNPRRNEHAYHAMLRKPNGPPDSSIVRTPQLFLPYPATFVADVETHLPDVSVYKPHGKLEWSEKDALDAYEKAKKRRAAADARDAQAGS